MFGTAAAQNLTVGQMVEWYEGGRLTVGELTSLGTGAHGPYATALTRDGWGGYQTRLLSPSSLAPMGSASRATLGPDPAYSEGLAFADRVNRGNRPAGASATLAAHDPAYQQAADWAKRRNGGR